MITLDLSILNQKGTPMFNSDLFANRPAAGIVGRIFISTDTKVFYRDTGTTWEELSGSTIGGSLATGQVAFGSATNTISGSNNLFWDDANGRLGIGTNAPATTLHSTGNVTFGTTTTNPTINFAASANASTAQFVINNSSFGGTNLTFRNTADTRYVRISGVNFDIINTGNITAGSSLIAGNITINSTTITGFNNSQLNLNGDTVTLASRDNTAATIILLAGNGAIQFVQRPSSVATTRAIFAQSTGNFILQNGGTFVDGGQRLQVQGDVFVQGLSQFRNATNYQIRISDGTFKWDIRAQATFSNTDLRFIDNDGNPRVTFFNQGGISIGNPTDQSGVLSVTGRNNNSSESALNVKSLSGAELLRARNDGQIFITTGSLAIKTTSPYAPSTFSLDVNGGLLVKNTAGTTAQITLINADPSLGGNNGFLVASAGGTSGASFVDLQGYYGASIVGSTALRLNPAGGAVIVNSTTNTGEQFQLTGTLRINGQSSGTSGGNSGQHLIINLDGTTYKIKLELP